jgi:hypothetical protein
MDTMQGAGYNRVEKRFRGGNMDSWKKAVVAGSVGAATILFLKKKMRRECWHGRGLAMLAAEYPEKV